MLNATIFSVSKNSVLIDQINGKIRFQERHRPSNGARLTQSTFSFIALVFLTVAFPAGSIKAPILGTVAP